MQHFSTTRDLSRQTGLTIDEGDSRGENFVIERDWGIFRGSGYGLSGSDGSGWLVTFAANKMTSDGRIQGPGYLVAHAIKAQVQRSNDWAEEPWDEEYRPYDKTQRFGGQCLLLGGPWDESENEKILHRATQQDWFESSPGGARVDVGELDRWLISIGRGLT